MRTYHRQGLGTGIALGLAIVAAVAAEPAAPKAASDEARRRAEMKLAEIPYRIVYESYRGGNWELCLVNADGTGQTALTHTPDIDELYPRVSPDGTRICFLADETVAGRRTRNLCLMDLAGGNRTRIAENAREGCWSADGARIAYLPGEFDKFTLTDYASKGLVVYEVATGVRTPHPNTGLHHLYNVSWTPDGNWFVATVHGGMGYGHAILAFEAHGTRVWDLGKWGVGGCRPDLDREGTRLAWGANDETLMAGDITFAGSEPKVGGNRVVAQCHKGAETYHIDWSPDGRHVAFSSGPEAGEQLGQRAPGWNICVADLAGAWVPITTDGLDNKEPDWVPLPAAPGK